MTAATNDGETSRGSDAKYLYMEDGTSNVRPTNAHDETPTSAPDAASSHGPSQHHHYRRKLQIGIISRVIPVAFLIWFFVAGFDANQEGQAAYIGFAVLAAYLSCLELGIMLAVYWHTIVDPVQDQGSNDDPPANHNDGVMSGRQQHPTKASPRLLYEMELAACRRFFGMTPVVMALTRELLPSTLSFVFRLIGHEYDESNSASWIVYLNGAVMVLPVAWNLVSQQFRPDPKIDASARLFALMFRDYYTHIFAFETSATFFSSGFVYLWLFIGDAMRFCLLNCGCIHGTY